MACLVEHAYKNIYIQQSDGQELQFELERIVSDACLSVKLHKMSYL